MFFLGVVLYLANITLNNLENYRSLTTSEIEMSTPIVIIGGSFLFWCMLFGVTLYEDNKKHVKIEYKSDNLIKINHKTYNINLEEMTIKVYKKFETYSATDGRAYYNFDYMISIGSNNKKNKKWKITEKSIEEFEEFIYNFEYEQLSEQQLEKLDKIYEMKDFYEKRFQGKVSQDEVEYMKEKILDEYMKEKSGDKHK